MGSESDNQPNGEVLAPTVSVNLAAMCETCIYADPRRGTMLVYCRHIERLRVLTHPACADYATP